MKNALKKTVALGLVMFLLTAAIIVTQIPIHAQDIPVKWSVTLHFNESGGRYDYVVFGEAFNASDGQDDYDLMEPPFPPQLPYLVVWFDTDLDEPYNKLWYDYRQYPDDYKVWNLSVIWMSEPGNESPVDIDISWDTSKIVESGYASVLLYGDDDIVVADMITENHYKFASSSGLMNYFQIICQSEIVDNNEMPFLYIILILIIIISILSFIFFVVYRKGKKSK